MTFSRATKRRPFHKAHASLNARSYHTELVQTNLVAMEIERSKSFTCFWKKPEWVESWSHSNRRGKRPLCWCADYKKGGFSGQWPKELTNKQSCKNVQITLRHQKWYYSKSSKLTNFCPDYQKGATTRCNKIPICSIYWHMYKPVMIEYY